jgi:hypothetical protein
VKTKPKGPVHAGGRKVIPSKMQLEVRKGRGENVQHKKKFREGALVKDTRGPNGPLIPERENATPPAIREESTDVTK